MDRERITDRMRIALGSIRTPRLFANERGYQGALIAELQTIAADIGNGVIIEQEHQKRLLSHGLRIRPDIIIHEPFDCRRHTNTAQGNIAAIELKRRATRRGAIADFKSLSQMHNNLNYPFVFFINVDSERTYVEAAPGSLRGALTCFSVALQNEQIIIHEDHHATE